MHLKQLSSTSFTLKSSFSGERIGTVTTKSYDNDLDYDTELDKLIFEFNLSETIFDKFSAQNDGNYKIDASSMQVSTSSLKQALEILNNLN